MGLQRSRDGGGKRFSAYVDGLASVIGHVDREGPLRDYCTGLVMPGARKSVEPMAAVTAPARVSAQHQSLLHFVGVAEWSDEKVLARVRETVLPTIESHGPIAAWIIDDTAFPKHGKHSVGVARQYCGQLGKQDNCQAAVSLSIANHHASLPVAWRLYLPKEWAWDRKRRKKAGVPGDIKFKTKPKIALDQIRWACAAGLPRAPVVMDAGYGADGDLRAKITGLELTYVAGIRANAVVRAATDAGPDANPDASRTASVEKLALALPRRAWQKIAWRQGTAEMLASRFARVRVRVAGGAKRSVEGTPEEWLLIEWPKDEKKPTKYWLSTLPETIDFANLVDTAKLRWRIERDYLELKQEIGLGHYEGRGWRGFHHHATLSIATYGFLISERESFPPSGSRSRNLLPRSAVPDGWRPRGAPAQT
jgi:SRSO17 transposase